MKYTVARSSFRRRPMMRTGILKDRVMKKRPNLGVVNLKTGIIPVSKAAATLSELIKRTQHKEHIIVTQNGYPAAVLVDMDSYTNMRELAGKYIEHLADDSDPHPSAPTTESNQTHN